MTQKDMAKPMVAIVVLNYNNWGDTIECLESVFRNRYPDYKVIMVDNGSTDNSLELIRAWAEGKLDLWIQPDQPLRRFSFPPVRKTISYVLISNSLAEAPEAFRPSLIFATLEDNLGYGRGNNVGIRLALEMGAEYICVLNNDAVVEGNFVDDAVSALHGLPENVAVIGPKILDYWDLSDWQRPTAKKQALMFIIPKAIAFKVKRKLKRDCWLYRMFWYTREGPAPVNTVPGSCMIFRAGALEKTGGFDENTFLYMEEDILADKLKGLGMAEYYIPHIRIYHKWGQSIGGASFVHLFRSSMYFYRSRRRVGLMGLVFLRLWFLFVFFAKLFTSRSFRNFETFKDFLHAFLTTRNKSLS